jgi:uncharacterized membrane protein YphA (DoxX/SURF4 family)
MAVRLTYNFPSGSPGYGLLLLRGALATALLVDTARMSFLGSSAATWPLGLGLLTVALAVSLGYRTRVVHVFLLTLGGIALVMQFPPFRPSVPPESAVDSLLLRIVIAAAIALCGPGMYSADARLLGRREINIPAKREPPR